MKLVIAEKPSVGAAIAAVMGANEKRSGYFEGGGYLVSWCIGHLISLADAATYNEQFRKWKYDDLPIVPQEWQFIVASGKEQQFSILKDLMHRSDVTEIINACDSGREGELIFRFVYEQANCKKPFSRLWISSMEESAIREGFSNLKDGRSYDNLYQSALCRAKADWLIGINATRLFSTPTERRYLLRVPLILDAKKDCSRHALQSPDFSYCEVNPLLFRLPLSPLLLRLQSVCLYRSYRPAARQAAAARWISPHCCSGRKIDLPKYDTGLQGHRIPVNSAVVPCSRYSQGSAGKYITRRLPFCGSRRIHFSRLL